MPEIRFPWPGRKPAHGVAAGILERDSLVPVAEAGRAREIGADQVALDDRVARLDPIE